MAAIPILLYHRVGPLDGSAMDRYTASPESFAEQMDRLAAQGWRGIALDDLFDGEPWSSKRNQVVITFDDGFASNRDHAWPVLANHGFRSTTFVVTREIGGTNSWDNAGMPRYPLLSAQDIRAAAPALMTFQSHGATHASLPEMDDPGVEKELRESRSVLEDLVGKPVAFFAYPFGSLDSRLPRLLRKAGYRAACSVRTGRNTPRTDPFLLRRVEILEGELGWRLRLKLVLGR